MVSFKVFAILPYALAAAAAATSPMPRDTPSTSYLILRTCVPPTNCGAPVGNCEFCCAGRKPNSNTFLFNWDERRVTQCTYSQ
ncbi:hypothetical protein TrVFT333_006873 [Trichoderma virens FT-333]|nr:hypothetical protein TrVFT333_006873 [Trichoderma virens FT-333]